jgi:hypothetical protein
VSETNLEQFREVTPAGRFTLQNSAMLKAHLENDQIRARLGSMVAYQGDVRFEYKSGGLGRFFKKAVTGEGVKLMVANGTGDLFLAQDKRKVMVLDLQNERTTVNGDNILAFDSGIDWASSGSRARAVSRAASLTSSRARARSPSPRTRSPSSSTPRPRPSPTLTRPSLGATASGRASGATSPSRPSPAAAAASRSRWLSRAPDGSSYNPRKDRSFQSSLTPARAAVSGLPSRLAGRHPRRGQMAFH